MMMMNDMIWPQLGSLMATLMFFYAMFQQYFPHRFRGPIQRLAQKYIFFLYPFIQIKFDEFTGERMKRSEVYTSIENYLSSKSTTKAKRLKAEPVKDSDTILLSMDDNEEVIDQFLGVKLWWNSNKNVTKTQSFSFYPASEEKRSYRLTFHRNDRDLITGSYLNYVMNQGKAMAVKNRQRKLYTNNPSSNWYGYKRTVWSHVNFEHPANFNTLAMDPKKKEEVMKDLVKFSKAKEYYERVGKAWKRGYLLYGPPGTGKSTMIVAMANLLNYDIYDLELTAVKDNSELRKLLIETTSKSIIVIEDIDCSLDLTGQRKKDKEEEEGTEAEKMVKKAKESEGEKSKVTLSGLLNFIDGIWSACGGERLIVFTTNYVDKLDPALIRRGRMDKHIELSYCGFEAFKVLGKNYMGIEGNGNHDGLYERVKGLLEEVKMTPADVAENLMCMNDDDDDDEKEDNVRTCLENLVEALEEAKEAERKKVEEEERLKEEKENEEQEKAKVKDKAKCNGVSNKEEDEKENAVAC